VILPAASFVAWTTILAASATGSDASDMLGTFLGLLTVTGLVLAICGSVMGYQRKIVVYDSRADLNITCISLISLAPSGIAFGISPFVGWPVVLVSATLFGASAVRAFKANRTVWRGVLSVFAKYALLGLVVLCALVALDGAFTVVEDAKMKRYKQAVGNAALAAGGAAGFVAVRRLLNRLVAERTPPIITGKASTASNLHDTAEGRMP